MPHVPRPRSANDTAINFRLPGAWLDDAQALVDDIAPPGAALTRQDVLRMALRRGLDEYRREVDARAKRRR